LSSVRSDDCIVGRNPGQHEIRVERPCGGLYNVDDLVGLFLELRKAVAFELASGQIRFEIELADLGRETAVVALAITSQTNGAGWSESVDKKHFLLGSDPPNAALDHSPVEHFTKRVEIVQYRKRKLAHFPLSVFACYVLVTHIPMMSSQHVCLVSGVTKAKR
jgi:hypothetical protein